MKISIAYGRGALWQWDTGRRLRVGSGVEQIHYQNRALGGSVDVDVGDDGTAIIPDELLQDCHTLTAYAYVTDGTGAYTMVQQDFAVHKRAKPAGYVYTPTDQMTLQTIQRQIGDLAELTTEAKENLVAAINEAARTGGGGAGSMDLRVADGYVQYSTDGGSTWANLIAVADLKGAKGDKGAPGKDGHSPVVTATKSGKTTTISVDGADIATVEDGADGKPGTAGADGAKGADGITPHIGDNGNWYIGSTDTGKPSRGATGAPGKDGAGMDITGATVGQIAKITAVDASGVPTAWEPVDMPNSDRETDMELIRHIEITDAVSAISINEDDDGEPFALREVKVYVKVRLSDSAVIDVKLHRDPAGSTIGYNWPFVVSGEAIKSNNNANYPAIKVVHFYPQNLSFSGARNWVADMWQMSTVGTSRGIGICNKLDYLSRGAYETHVMDAARHVRVEVQNTDIDMQGDVYVYGKRGTVT